MNPENSPTLYTDRLILRRFAPEDLGALFLILSDEEVNTYLPWFPKKTMEEVREFYVERYEKPYLQPRGYRYAICLKEDNIPIGYIAAGIDGGCDFGYGLQKDHWGKGYVTEAGKALIALLRKDGVPFITATHDVNNPKSGEVMKRLGMTYRYSYREQWQPKDFPVIFRMYQLNLDGNAERVFMDYWQKYPVHFIKENT